MATIRFTQCCNDFKQDPHSEAASKMPVLPRMDFYVSILTRFPHNDFATMDENMLLVAQWMKRNKRLRDLTLISVCCHGGNERVIETDADGDMGGEPHHGFFTQRLQYLR
jgi:hypothetical protein